MIEISEPLEGSEPGIRTLHQILLDGKKIGRINAGYIGKKDIKTFRRSKRKLKVGQPFGVQVFIDAAESNVSASDLGFEGMKELTDSLKERLAGLEDRDIYILEIVASKTAKQIVGRWDKMLEQKQSEK
jgi:hypothetical protein